MRVHLQNHPSFGRPQLEGEATLEERLFMSVADKGVLLGPGWMFATKVDDQVVQLDKEMAGDAVVQRLLKDAPSGDPEDHDPSQYAHFRISFSTVTVSISRRICDVSLMAFGSVGT